MQRLLRSNEVTLHALLQQSAVVLTWSHVCPLLSKPPRASHLCGRRLQSRQRPVRSCCCCDCSCGSSSTRICTALQPAEARHCCIVGLATVPRLPAYCCPAEATDIALPRSTVLGELLALPALCCALCGACRTRQRPHENVVTAALCEWCEMCFFPALCALSKARGSCR